VPVILNPKQNQPHRQRRARQNKKSPHA
jgi:hypothetical protein